MFKTGKTAEHDVADFVFCSYVLIWLMLLHCRAHEVYYAHEMYYYHLHITLNLPQIICY